MPGSRRFKVAFESDIADYSARLTRAEAENVLDSEGFRGVTNAITGGIKPTASLSDERLAVALSRSTMLMVERLTSAGLVLTVRDDPDDEPQTPVTVRAAADRAVRVGLLEEVAADEEANETADDADAEPTLLPWYSEDRIH